MCVNGSEVGGKERLQRVEAMMVDKFKYLVVNHSKGSFGHRVRETALILTLVYILGKAC